MNIYLLIITLILQTHDKKYLILDLRNIPLQNHVSHLSPDHDN